MLDHTSTGFQPKIIDLKEMVDIDVKKVVIIGDGMSGKTQTLITFGKKLLTYLHKIYSARSILEERFSEDAGLEVALESFGDSYEVDPAFKSWAERYGFLLQYGNNKWNVTSISLDTETIGFEDFHFIFPFVWNNKTYRINLVGSDVGGQNIFDHFRTVLGKIAGANDILMVVFDKSRALSCWNSIDQVQKVVGDKISEQRLGQSNIPRIVYVGNKIDLEEHINKQEWQNNILNSIMKTFSQIADYRQGVYQLPSLVGKKGVERSFNFKIENNLLHFPDFEALVYNAIRETDPEYRTQKIMTDVNAKAIAREMNLPVTAFVSSSLKANLKIEFFTPKKEVPISGHAIIATLWLLAEIGKIVPENNKITLKIETKLGLIPAEIKWKNNSVDKVYMTQKKPKFREVEVNKQKLADILGIRTDKIETNDKLPLIIADTGSPKLLVLISSKEMTDALVPKFDEVERLCRRLKVTGLHLYTFDTYLEGSTCYTRQFEPIRGASETIVSGMANGALGAYLVSKGFAQPGALIIEQGESLERPGKVELRIKATADEVKSVRVGGKAQVIFKFELYKDLLE